MMVKVEVKLFANLKEAAGTDAIFLEFPSAPSIGDVLMEAVRRAPALKKFLLKGGEFNDRYKILVGQELVFKENFSRALEGTRVAILPPVSGG